MAETELGLEPEVQEIFEHVIQEHNFLLSGGAGSGKTYSLVQFIQEAIRLNPAARIACMTYTNAAVNEIEERVNHENLHVSTIHDFLWDNIKSFQNELKKSLIHLINDENIQIIKSPDGIVDATYYEALVKGIQYKEYTAIKDGIISHNEVLILANHLFETYSKLCDILKDKFKFILIDEYQDTNPAVVEIFLKHLNKSNRKNIIGFFGDSMQSIYDDGIGDLNTYIEAGDVYEVKKGQNRRNPYLVIKLANRLRTDGIEQHPSTDSNAPNMQDEHVKDGSVEFYYSVRGVDNLEEIKDTLGWDFDNAMHTKELNLTHNLIAPKAGFGELMEIYDGDKILDYKKRITDYIKKNNITTDFSEKTFAEVIEILKDGKTGAELNRVNPTAGMKTFIDTHPEQFEDAKRYPFESFKKIYLDKDSLLDDTKKDKEDENKKGTKRDDLIKHLFKIQSNINLYKEERYNEFLRKTEYQINSITDKHNLKETVETLDGMSDETIENVINYAHEKAICKKDDKFYNLLQNKEYVFNQVKKIKFQVFQKLFFYLEGYTPFSTQHKIKGAEFNNVLVVLDNGNWNEYNFEYLMNEEIFDGLTASKKSSFPKILNRTQKIFYVCCTRAKENLVVFYNTPTGEIIEKAKIWFGEENIHSIDE